jgi:murein DD-endopeptidase MepM/ murein hydrolase activator NlpD
MRRSFNGEHGVSNPFGVYDPSAYARYPGMKHPGTDYALPADTPLVAGMSGTVIVAFSTGRTGRGNEAIITNGNIQRKACHLNRIDVKQGQWVNEGDLIGLSGFTGYVVDYAGNIGTPGGAHLHDELLIDGVYVDLEKQDLEEDEMIDSDDKARDVLVALFHEDAKNITQEAIDSIKWQPYSSVLPTLMGYTKWRDQNDKLVAYGALLQSKTSGLTEAQQRAVQALKEAFKS